MLKAVPPKHWTLDDKIQYYILGLLKCSVALAIIWAFTYGKWEQFFLSLLALVLMYLPEFIESRARLNLPIEFDLTIVVFIYASQFLGEVVNAYEHFWWWDAVLHTSSGILLGFAGFLLLYIKVKQGKLQASPLLIGVIIFSFAMSFGAVWEIFEFTIDSLFHTNMQKSGLVDTMWDLIVDAGGAITIAFVGARYISRGGKSVIARLVRNFIAANPRLN